MKPNKKQIRAWEEIRSQMGFWQYTNDINSPTHSCDIDEMMRNYVVFGDFTESEADELNVKLQDLLQFVQSLNGR